MSAAVTRALPPTVWSDIEDTLDCLLDTEDELPSFDDDDVVMVRIHDGLVTLRTILGAANEVHTAEELAEVFAAWGLGDPAETDTDAQPEGR